VGRCIAITASSLGVEFAYKTFELTGPVPMTATEYARTFQDVLGMSVCRFNGVALRFVQHFRHSVMAFQHGLPLSSWWHIGYEVIYKDQPPNLFRKAMLGFGWSPVMADMLIADMRLIAESGSNKSAHVVDERAINLARSDVLYLSGRHVTFLEWVLGARPVFERVADHARPNAAAALVAAAARSGSVRGKRR